MEKNFSIGQTIYLLDQKLCYDLHNNYDFSQMNILPSETIVSMVWLKLERDWVKIEDPNEIKLNFRNVCFFEISNTLIFERISTVHEIGYKEPSDKDLDWLGSEDDFKPTDHIIFRFENDEYIRIHAEFAELITTNIQH